VTQTMMWVAKANIVKIRVGCLHHKSGSLQRI